MNQVSINSPSADIREKLALASCSMTKFALVGANNVRDILYKHENYPLNLTKSETSPNRPIVLWTSRWHASASETEKPATLLLVEILHLNTNLAISVIHGWRLLFRDVSSHLAWIVSPTALIVYSFPFSPIKWICRFEHCSCRLNKCSRSKVMLSFPNSRNFLLQEDVLCLQPNSTLTTGLLTDFAIGNLKHGASKKNSCLPLIFLSMSYCQLFLRLRKK